MSDAAANPGPRTPESRFPLPDGATALDAAPLPNVERPRTDFFLQLFFLPAMIVMTIVIIWYLFGVLGGEGDIDSLVREVCSTNPGRWRQAADLSQLLSRPESQYARDRALCARLAEIFTKHLQEKRPENAQLLEYLAGAMGQFQLTTGVPALRHATRAEQPRAVRRAALVSLLRLAERLKNLNDPLLGSDLLALLDDPNVELRGLAAMTLGFLGEGSAIGGLERRLSDADASVRYNVANALARLGSTTAVPTLLEMLDSIAAERALQIDQSAPPGANKQAAHARPIPPGQSSLALITTLTALRSLHRLASIDPPIKGLDRSTIQAKVETLKNSPHAELVNAAQAVLIDLKKHGHP